eukprot:15328303-Ditylum_brightwellii.AAC.1
MDARNVNFDLEDEGSIEDYLRMITDKLSDRRIRIAYLKIIQSIIDEMCIPPNLKTKEAPVSTTRFCKGPRDTHAIVVYIVSQLEATQDKDIIWDLDTRQYFSVYIEAGFSGN